MTQEFLHTYPTTKKYLIFKIILKLKFKSRNACACAPKVVYRKIYSIIINNSPQNGNKQYVHQKQKKNFNSFVVYVNIDFNIEKIFNYSCIKKNIEESYIYDIQKKSEKKEYIIYDSIYKNKNWVKLNFGVRSQDGTEKGC